MKLIIPMAGIGKRMRPHTLTVPKPLLRVAGESIVSRIINDFADNSGKKVTEIHYIIGQFGKKVEDTLLNIAKAVDANGFIHYQKTALGTAHAIFCAEKALNNEVCIAFADTLYFGDISISETDEAIIWTYEVENPESYGVVLIDEKEYIKGFIEKPKERISNRAIVGMYYFKHGEALKKHINELIEQDRKVNGEFQITDALENMLKLGINFKSKNISGWLDFGKKDNFIVSLKAVLEREKAENKNENEFDNTVIIEPVYLGENVKIRNSKIGPYVSIDTGTDIDNSEIVHSSIGSDSKIVNCDLNESIIGSVSSVTGFRGELNIGDYNEIKT